MNTKKSKNTKIQKDKRHRSPWHYLIIAGIVLVVYFFLQGSYGFISYWQLQQQKKELYQQIKELKKQKAELIEKIDKLKNDLQYIEKIVREKYKMGKDGEKIYFMVSPSNKKKE